MIHVKLNENNFEYDIYSLIKAFYPREEICLTGPGQKEPDQEEISFRFEVKEIPTKDALDEAGRREAKNRIKQTLYKELCGRTGRTLPWGTLTGIRPTKIPLHMLEQGESEEEITAYISKTYLASEEKTTLSIEIAKRELTLLRKLDYQDGYSLYIGIPFCPSRCLYCSFTGYPQKQWESRMDEYLDALEQELVFVKKHLSQKKCNTVYVGGGTPTTLSPAQLDRLLSMVEKNVSMEHVLEFTVEAGRPDSITEEKLRAIRAHSVVDRISVNPQTMNQRTLDIIGRQHTVEQTVESFYLARKVGFEHINMDLIMGLPGETLEDVAHTMEEITRLRPDNLTVHSLAIKRAARLSMERDRYLGYPMENSQAHIDLAFESAKKLGMHPYYLYRQKNMAGNLENIGFAKEGAEGIYNILIMEEKQTIMALGAGAACKYVSEGGSRVTRSENVKDVALYMERLPEMIARKREKLEEIGWL